MTWRSNWNLKHDIPEFERGCPSPNLEERRQMALDHNSAGVPTQIIFTSSAPSLRIR